MGDTVGQIDLGLDINKNSFNKKLLGISKGAEKSVSSAFSGLGKKIGLALGTAAIGAFVKSCLDLGSDLSEVQNVVDVTFQQMNNSVNEFAKNAMEQFGLSETVAKKYMGTYGAMTKAFGFTEKQAYDMSKTITGLTADVASFYNLGTDEAYTKMKSIWTGETESLKDLGVVMTQTALDQYALNNGFGKTTANMTEQEKVMLRYQFVQSQLSAANGDFARTSDGWANQIRVLTLRFESLKATLGQGFINLFTPIVKSINLVLSKLQTLAEGFKTFTEVITGKKATEQTNGAIASIGADAVSSSNDISGMGDVAKETAKKINKSLTGIDQVNILNDNSGDASASIGGTGGSGGNSELTGLASDLTSGIEESTNKTNVLLESVKNKFLELAELFKQGFNIGVGEHDFNPITTAINSIKTSLGEIFTDSKVQSSANSWVDTVVLSLGRITGSAASIGLTTANLFIGSMDKYLSQNNGYLKGKITDLLDLTAEKASIVADYSSLASDIFSVFGGDNAQQIGADLLAILSTIALETSTFALQLGNDVLDALLKPLEDNKGKIKTALDNYLGIASESIGSIKDFITNTFKSISSSYKEYVKPAIDKFSEGFSIVFSAILDAYNNYLAPTFKKISDKGKELINGPIKEVVQKFTDLVGKIIDGIATIWKETLAPFLAWVIDKLAPKFAKNIENMGDFFVKFLEVSAKVVGDLLDAFGGLIDFIVGVFTGDWEKAWNGIKTFFSSIIQGIKDLVSPIGDFFKVQFNKAVTNVKGAFNGIKSWFQEKYNDITGVFANIPTWFKNKFTEAWTNVKNVFSTGGKIFDGIKDGIANVFKSVVNTLIKGINTIISSPFKKINEMLNTIRSVSVFGLQPFGGLWSNNPLPVPQIPALAQGGYVKANTPQLAMIGDNKHEGEVVAPESKLIQMALEAAKLAGGSGGLTEAGLYRVMAKVFQEYMHFYIGEEDLARHVNRGNEMIDLRNNPVKGGGR